ncbi:hypothetical protein [Clostridium beijerinckii]|nr:hypothetical protein [Clostridium beijerinckii]
MDEEMTDFIKCCLELGKDLLDKETLNEKEEKFINQLNNIIEKYLK